jgi:Ca2+-binding RTX toxin-like protein
MGAHPIQERALDEAPHGAYTDLMQGRAALGLALATTVAFPAAAAGSEVSVVPMGENNELFYEADAGEENDLSVSSDGATVTFTDPGAEITPGNGCMSASSTEADCTFAGPATVNITLRGDPDEAEIQSGFVNGRFHGGGGADRLIGGPGFDVFEGDAGPDVMAGRAGSDFLRYIDRSDDLHVTLGDGVRNDGGPADGPLRDKVNSMEAVVGGEGDDVLAGTGGDNTINGLTGHDVLRGLGGDDDFYPDDGRDSVRGGAGDDLVTGSSGRDQAVGGPGDDHFQGGSPLNGADLFAGRSGHDTVQYSFGQVRVKLDGRANDGACADPACASSDEGDNAKGIEEIQAPDSDDVLIGSNRDEVFRPSAGVDAVRARGGDDTVYLNVDGDVDTVDCGNGTDAIVGTPDAFDINQNCE